MKIKDEKSDAIQLIKDLKKEMAVIREMIAELEYVVYECDERCQIVLFERGQNGRKKESEERVRAD
jgi:hypothetical protein